MILQGYGSRAKIAAASATTVGFEATTNLDKRPIVLAKDGRVGVATSAVSAATASGGAGTKYVCADLDAPSGQGWGGTGSFIDAIEDSNNPNRVNYAQMQRMLFPDDATLAYAAHNSVVSLIVL